MVRNVILRIPVIRSMVPRVSRPLLPLTRLATTQSSLTSHRPGNRDSTRMFSHFSARLTPSPPPSPSHDPHSSDPSPNAALSQRLKHLIKAYGWYALGVYFLLSVVDFTVAFAAVNVLGAEHVSRVAASVKDYFTNFFPAKPIEPGREDMDVARPVGAGGQEGLYAMIVLAYTIHKTLFLPVRVGLTAAFTPRLVGWLRARGWAGGAGAKRAAQEVREKIRDMRDRD